MKTIEMTLPDLLLLVGTRALLGVGIGLLVSDRLSPERRKAAGVTLLGVGLLTTIPLALTVISAARDTEDKQNNHE